MADTLPPVFPPSRWDPDPVFLETPSPGAGLASYQDMVPLQWEPEGFYLGQTAPEVTGYPVFDVGINDDRAVFIAAGTRGGKGVSLLVPNLIGWPGGAFCIDVKGELASFTAMRRSTRAAAEGSGTTVTRFLGQEVAVLDPMGEVQGPARVYRTGYNPLSELNPRSPTFISEVRTIARSIILSEDGSNAFFSDMASIILGGIIQVVVLRAQPHQKNLVTVRNIIVEGKAMKFLAKAPDGELVKEALGALARVGENEGGSYHTSLVRNLAWIADPRMKDFLKDTSGFSLMRTIQDDGTVYVSLPFADLGEQSRWLRLMLAMGLNAKLRQGVYRRGEQSTLFVVDEMPALGPLDMLEKGMGYLAGYGVKAVAVVQNIGQLRQLYAKNWQTFLGNTGAVCAFSLNDQETARYVSERLGHYEFMEESYSRSVSHSDPKYRGKRGLFGTRKEVREYEARAGTNTSENWSMSRKIEPIMRPEQVQQRTARRTSRMIVLPAEGRPMMLARVPYNERFSTEWYDPEKNILRVEKALSGHSYDPEKSVRGVGNMLSKIKYLTRS
ncbi:MAG: type IV secretory system conjugative DNA transfer family protein [Pseudomonadota bacterium]|nr:type IV secretory system conjugative DNA transfer family protein [Pseudomonadota bacterium]